MSAETAARALAAVDLNMDDADWYVISGADLEAGGFRLGPGVTPARFEAMTNLVRAALRLRIAPADLHQIAELFRQRDDLALEEFVHVIRAATLGEVIPELAGSVGPFAVLTEDQFAEMVTQHGMVLYRPLSDTDITDTPGWSDGVLEEIPQPERVAETRDGYALDEDGIVLGQSERAQTERSRQARKWQPPQVAGLYEKIAGDAGLDQATIVSAFRPVKGHLTDEQTEIRRRTVVAFASIIAPPVSRRALAEWIDCKPRALYRALCGQAAYS